MTHAPAFPSGPARRLAACLLGGGLFCAAWPGLPALAQNGGYAVELEGVENEDLARLLRDTSRLFALRDRPPLTGLGLRRRAEADRERLNAALRSEGYFDASLGIDVRTPAEGARVILRVEPGPRYSIGDVSLSGLDGTSLDLEEPLQTADLGLQPGQPARGPDILAAEDRIGPALAARGYAYPRVLDRRLVVDHSSRSMNVTFVVAPGPPTRLGEIAIVGLEDVEEKAVRRRLPFATGDRFDPAMLESARSEIAELGVFSSVRVQLADEPQPGGDGTAVAPVTITVAERDQRFIGFGLNYSTEDGAGASAYWGHRNLLGAAQRFRVDAAIAGVGRNDSAGLSEFDYSLGAIFVLPDFLTRRQSLNLSAELVAERPDAFDRNALVASAILERSLGEGLIGSAGLTFEQSRIDEGEQTTTNTLFGVPVALSLDRSDSLLNPTTGFRLSLAATPYLGALGDSSSFTVARLGGSAYWSVDGAGDWVVAGRAVLGSIFGAELLNVPADKRFYAGGGGSIRGFGFQDVGPLGPDGDPLGGRSLLEFGAELRVKVTDTIGIVPFLDGGNVYTGTLPDFDETLRFGAGLGVRYYTAIGPIRVDFATPLNKRAGDSSFQFYISVGQSF